VPTLARLAVRWWWAIIVFWLVLAGTLHVASPTFSEVATFDETAFLNAEAGAIRGGRLVAEGWPDDNFSRTAAIVIAREDGELTDDDLDHVEAVVDWFRSGDAPNVFDDVTTHLDDPTLAPTFVADDGQAVFLLVGLNAPPYTPPVNDAVAAARDHLRTMDAPDGLEVLVTGSAGVGADESKAIEDSVNRTHLLTLLLVVVILLWVYRSPITPLVPLITIGVAFSVAMSVVSLLAQAGLQVASMFETFSIVIVFGAGTDYCLFLISRYHEELDLAEQRGYVPNRPLRMGTMSATLLVLAAVLGSSAATTIAGFMSMGLARFGLYRSMGPAMAIAVSITLLATLTLAPALMRLFGRRLFWPNAKLRGDHGATTPLVEQHGDRLRLTGLERHDLANPDDAEVTA
jgi:RND superfamily putative drug exporter